MKRLIGKDFVLLAGKRGGEPEDKENFVALIQVPPFLPKITNIYLQIFVTYTCL
jgi:hypothetical protein